MIHQRDAGLPVILARTPLASAAWRDVMPAGRSIQEIVDLVPTMSPADRCRAVVLVNDTPVPREYWSRVRPKVNGTRAVMVTIHLAPLGGGEGGGGKQVLAIVAAIALIAATAWIGGGGLAFMGGAQGLFAAGSISAKIAAAVVGGIGALALQALSPPPAKAANGFNDASQERTREASASGNIIDPGGAIPVAIGVDVKIFPPMLTQPIIDSDGDDEVVESVYGLNGPHRLLDIRVEDTPIGQIPGIVYEQREGWDSDGPLNVVTRYAAVTQVDLSLKGHDLEDDGLTLDTDMDPTAAVPSWGRSISGFSPDELWITLTATSGIFDGDATSTDVAVPVRMRMRPVGTTTWINLPELHIVSRRAAVLRKVIKLKFGGGTPGSSTGGYAFGSVPAQSVAPTVGGWTAAAPFVGAGLAAQLVETRYEGATIYLPTATFPAGYFWEVEVIRGMVYVFSFLNPANYQYGGIVYDFFGYYQSSGNKVPVTQKNKYGDLGWTRLQSIYNEAPVQAPGFALIAMRGRNVNISRVNVLASRYVPDWNGTDWSNWTVTDNPAPHYRDILIGNQTAPRRRVLQSELDDDEILEWRTFCASKGIKVGAIIDDATVATALQLVASTGYARPRRSDRIGVMWDRDRSAETATQLFTPRNSRGFRMSKAFTVRPDSFRVTFRDRASGYDRREIIVTDPESTNPEELTEAVSYDGLVDEALVLERALFDFRQMRARDATYTLEVDIEFLIAGRGSLVEVATDVFDEHTYYARIVAVTVNGSNQITSVEVDSEVTFQNPVGIYSVTNFYAMPSIYDQGIRLSMAIRRPEGGGVVTVPCFAMPAGTTTLIVPDTPFAALDMGPGDLVAFGPSTAVTQRMIVMDLMPRDGLTATLTLVDEAPEIHL